jgi:hypothetical protein
MADIYRDKLDGHWEFGQRVLDVSIGRELSFKYFSPTARTSADTLGNVTTGFPIFFLISQPVSITLKSLP